MTMTPKLKVIGDSKIDPPALNYMQECGGDWFVYQNMAMDSIDLGHLQFLKCGPDCTCKAPPERMPDSHLGIGWRYLLVGKVNLDNGEIEFAILNFPKKAVQV